MGIAHRARVCVVTVVCGVATLSQAFEKVVQPTGVEASCPEGVRPPEPRLPRLSDWPFYYAYDELSGDLKARVSRYLTALSANDINGMAELCWEQMSDGRDGIAARLRASASVGRWLSCRPLLAAHDARRPEVVIVYHAGVFRMPEGCIEGAGFSVWAKKDGEWVLVESPW